MSNMLLIHEPSKWGPFSFGHEVTHASGTIIDPPVRLTGLIYPLSTREHDVQILATTINEANTIVVNFNALQYHYDSFIEEAI
jgi:hypothetical protein